MPPFYFFLNGHLTEQVFYKILHLNDFVGISRVLKRFALFFAQEIF
jgi:hypothetical protein